MKNSPIVKIALISTFFALLSLACIARYKNYLDLQSEWNQRHYILRNFLKESDSVAVVLPYFRVIPTTLFEINNKEEIEELLSLIEFKQEVDISFWKEPMLPKNHLGEVSFCMDLVHIEFFHSGSSIGLFWITPSCRELKFLPSNSFGRYYPETFEQAVLTDESFEKIDRWFSERGVDHYHNPITPEQIMNIYKVPGDNL